MKNAPVWALITMLGGLAAGCQSDGGPTHSPNSDSQQSTRAASSSPQPAYLNARPLTWADLQTPLAEAAGGIVLSEIVLDRMIDKKLAEQGKKITQADLDREKELLLKSFDTDPNQAMRLLNALRDRQGWGDTRFQALLRRNAGLRILVQGDVQIDENSLKQAYDLQYGATYEVRLIVVDSLPQAVDLARRARSGESFGDLAVAHSTDSSRDRGGLLSPINPADQTYPAAIRQAMAKLSPTAAVSDPIALERGFAVIRLERMHDPRPVKFDQVKDELNRLVRLQAERILMEREAREIIIQADLTVLDPALAKSWERQKKLLTPQP